MELPIVPHEYDNSGSLEFHEWLPLGKDQSIVVCEEGISLTFWFNLECVGLIKEFDEEDVPRYVKIPVDKVFADVVVEEVPDELADFIAYTDYYKRSSDDHTSEEKRLIPKYEQLGKRVYVFTLERLNRLLSFARSEKGQYWLENYIIDPDQMGSAFTGFRARVKSEDSDWNLFEPTQLGGVIRAEIDFSTDRRIGQDDWPGIGEFVASAGSTDLVKDLLAGAESLARSGHRRSALTEAVTALEVAVSRFARHPNADSVFGSKFAERLNLDSLKTQHDRLGSTSTISYLFPLIFTEEQMPSEILAGCQEAISQRQNVVHQGQRDVDEEKLSLFLRSIRRMCFVLHEYSQESPRA